MWLPTPQNGIWPNGALVSAEIILWVDASGTDHLGLYCGLKISLGVLVLGLLGGALVQDKVSLYL